MPRSVLHILGTAQSEGTGIARIVAGLARGLAPRGYVVHACFLGKPGPLVAMLRDAGAEVSALNLPPGRSFSGAWRLWREFRSQRFSIIHQHAGGPLITRLARLATGAKIVLHLWGRVIEAQGLDPALTPIRNADVVIACSRAVARYVRGMTPRVIYAGVALPAHLREMPSVCEARPTIIGTGCRFVPMKDVPTLVRAFGLLHAEFPRASLEIAGDGPQRENILELVDQLELRDCVGFLGWAAEFPATLAKWDIFVIPSREEAFGVAAIEAMAAGLPVVASNVGGLPEIVQDGETGWLVPPGDPQELAGQLRRLLLHPEERWRMGSQGHVYARTHFSEERMAAQIAEIYDELG